VWQTCERDQLLGAPGSVERTRAELLGPARFCNRRDPCEPCDETMVHEMFWEHVSVRDNVTAWRMAARDPSLVRAIFVRNPFARFLSGLRDKGWHEFADLMQLRLSERDVLARCSRTAQLAPLPGVHESQDEVELACLARAAVDFLWERQRARRSVFWWAAEDARPINAHWRPQADICGATVIPYDFFGRTEHLAFYEASLFGAQDWLSSAYSDPVVLERSSLKHSSKPPEAALRDERLQWEWAQVRRLGLWLGEDGLRKFLDVYAVDFALFGYDPDPQNYAAP
jgi:hypothetical protein